MKVIVIKIHGNDDIVCPKSSFTEDSNGVLRLVKAWELNNTNFHAANCYRVDVDFNLVLSYEGKKRENAYEPKILRNVSIKEYQYYYEDEIQALE